MLGNCVSAPPISKIFSGEDPHTPTQAHGENPRDPPKMMACPPPHTETPSILYYVQYPILKSEAVITPLFSVKSPILAGPGFQDVVK